MRFIRMMKGNTGTTEKNVGGSNRPFFLSAENEKRPARAFFVDRFASRDSALQILDLAFDAVELFGFWQSIFLFGDVRPDFRQLGVQLDEFLHVLRHFIFREDGLGRALGLAQCAIDALIRQLQRLLAERHLLATGPARPPQFWTSADPEHLRRILPLLWNKSDSVQSFSR